MGTEQKPSTRLDGWGWTDDKRTIPENPVSWPQPMVGSSQPLLLPTLVLCVCALQPRLGCSCSLASWGHREWKEVGAIGPAEAKDAWQIPAQEDGGSRTHFRTTVD